MLINGWITVSNFFCLLHQHLMLAGFFIVFLEGKSMNSRKRGMSIKTVKGTPLHLPKKKNER